MYWSVTLFQMSSNKESDDDKINEKERNFLMLSTSAQAKRLEIKKLESAKQNIEEKLTLLYAEATELEAKANRFCNILVKTQSPSRYSPKEPRYKESVIWPRDVAVNSDIVKTPNTSEVAVAPRSNCKTPTKISPPRAAQPSATGYRAPTPKPLQVGKMSPSTFKTPTKFALSSPLSGPKVQSTSKRSQVGITSASTFKPPTKAAASSSLSDHKAPLTLKPSHVGITSPMLKTPTKVATSSSWSGHLAPSMNRTPIKTPTSCTHANSASADNPTVMKQGIQNHNGGKKDKNGELKRTPVHDQEAPWNNPTLSPALELCNEDPWYEGATDAELLCVELPPAELVHYSQQAKNVDAVRRQLSFGEEDVTYVVDQETDESGPSQQDKANIFKYILENGEVDGAPSQRQTLLNLMRSFNDGPDVDDELTDDEDDAQLTEDEIMRMYHVDYRDHGRYSIFAGQGVLTTSMIDFVSVESNNGNNNIEDNNAYLEGSSGTNHDESDASKKLHDEDESKDLGNDVHAEANYVSLNDVDVQSMNDPSKDDVDASNNADVQPVNEVYNNAYIEANNKSSEDDVEAINKLSPNRSINKRIKEEPDSSSDDVSGSNAPNRKKKRPLSAGQCHVNVKKRIKKEPDSSSDDDVSHCNDNGSFSPLHYLLVSKP